MTEVAKSPRGLGVHGRRLWRSVAEDVANEGLELTSTERFWLESAAKLTDQVAVVEAALVDAPMYMTGSMSQKVANPLLSELRQLHLAVSLTLARLKTDVPEERAVMGGVYHQRRGANIRWGRSG
jgi:hypothetical protein